MEAAIDHFTKREQERYGKPIENVGFYADVIADALKLPGLPDRVDAYSVAEAIRIGMTRVLDMEPEDLQILAIGHAGQDEVDAILYDPMPGGSGLLEQACERWDEIVAAALEVVEGCAGVCERSCIDCLQTFPKAGIQR